LIRDADNYAAFREVFGDERQDYAAALKRHYETGPPADWGERFVSPYASAHPWEDWAESWAHFMHMIDALETASAAGLALLPAQAHEPTLWPLQNARLILQMDFDELVERWLAVAHVINNLNRGLGLADGYPFVLTPPVLGKLRFVHALVCALQPRENDEAQPPTGESEAAPSPWFLPGLQVAGVAGLLLLLGVLLDQFGQFDQAA
jgi:hypothetical protein